MSLKRSGSPSSRTDDSKRIAQPSKALVPSLSVIAQTDNNEILQHGVDAGLAALMITEAVLKNNGYLELLGPAGVCLANTTAALNKTEEYLKPDTVIGVIGETGVGKSSLINSLLDYECIAPVVSSPSH